MYGRAAGNAQCLYTCTAPIILTYVNHSLERSKTFTTDSGRQGSLRPVHHVGRPRRTRTVAMEEEEVLTHVEQPSTSTREIAHTIGISQSSVWRVLHDSQLYLFHPHGLRVDDFPRRVHFCKWIVDRCENEPNFLNNMLFTDEAQLTRD
ncbi:hypothetical protein ANN_18760 [Periplaneta americana]|uniref:Uncharacterized protein n=1 Tax=Periplaneta americana TaxID=6978 RepID=A0ABQ8SQ55_PERAM|nr:hypothetical protein ANN_18760 [Periplaneta americana]